MATQKGRKRRTRASKESESEYELSDDIDAEESESEFELSPPPQKRMRKANRYSHQEHKLNLPDLECTDTSKQSDAFWAQKCRQLTAENKALKQRVSALEQEVSSLKSTVTAAANAPRSSINGKKYFSTFAKRLKTVAKLKKTKFSGSGDITVETIMDFEDFSALFDGKGSKIQPTPKNKPRSIKTIIQFDDWNAVAGLFDDYDVNIDQEITASYWYIGGWNAGKSYCMGTCQAKIRSLEVEYNKSRKTLKLNFYAVSTGSVSLKR